MKQKTKSWEFTSDKYGAFIIAQNGPKQFNIWWDFLDEMEGGSVEPGEHFDDLLEFFKENGCDVTDFSDLPKNGDFVSLEDAVKYLENKFGEKIELE